MHFILRGEWEKTQASFLAARVVPQCSLTSPELQAHICEQGISALHTLAVPLWLTGRVMVVVTVGAVGRAVSTSSRGFRFDSKDEAGAARGASRICRCLPTSLPSLPPSQARGGTGHQLPGVQEPTQAQA